MTNKNDYERFKNLNFEKFREMAVDPTLNIYEKIGFPAEYRKGFEERIWEDICTKLPLLHSSHKVIVDIGPGCGQLPLFLIELCRQRNHTLVLIDSEEMLHHLPEESFIIKVPGCFPSQVEGFLKQYHKQIDSILCYSVFHYVFAEENIFQFLDQALLLLKEGGEILIGDIPNISKRKRFFSSSKGVLYHQHFTRQQIPPEVQFNCVENGYIDDAVIFALLLRARAAGYDAYVVEQHGDLPMANRREDILIKY